MRTCPREAATQPSQEALCAEDLSAQVSCKASGCPPFQASCTCVETRPVAGGREKWGGGEAEVPPSVCQVGREEGGRGAEPGRGEVEKLVVPCPPSRGWRWQAGVETDFSSGSCL